MEGLDHLALLTFDGNGLVATLQFLFYIAASEYENGMGNLWGAKGEPPPEGLFTLANLFLLHFTCNLAVQVNIQG